MKEDKAKGNEKDNKDKDKDKDKNVSVSVSESYMTSLLDRLFFSNINSQLKTITASQTKLEKLIMGVKEDFNAFAQQINDVTNVIGGNVDKVAQLILDLKTQIAAGTLTPAEVAEKMTPLVEHLNAASSALAAVAEGGEVVVPPVEPL